MTFFRVYEKLEGHKPLGFGNSAGRWNKGGTPLIYTSSSLALSMLEHYSIKGSVVGKKVWEVALLEIDQEIPFIETLDLPQDWNTRPYPSSTLNFGTNWAMQQIGLCVAVPSIRIPLFRFPEEYNLLLNPLYPDFNNQVKVLDLKSVDFELNTIVS